MSCKLHVYCALIVAYAALSDLPAQAAIAVSATRFGNYAADGIGNINSPGFQNYFAGYSTPSAVAERRNFFIFPTASFVAETIISGELILYVPKFAPGVTTDPGDGYHSPDPSETFVITPTPFPASEVGDPTNTPAESIPIWSSLGMGPLAGSIEVFPSDKGTYVHIPLTPSAIMALNMIGPGMLVMGGRIISLDHTRPMVLDELLFSSTDMPGSGMFTPPTLMLEVVPAPPTVLLVLFAIALRRRRTL